MAISAIRKCSVSPLGENGPVVVTSVRHTLGDGIDPLRNILLVFPL